MGAYLFIALSIVVSVFLVVIAWLLPYMGSGLAAAVVIAMGSRRLRILLVEDTEINRMIVRRIARDLNVVVDEAENGKEAVDYFRQGNKCDVVLMDKDMPIMDGHEATRNLREIGVTTPIIALSSDDLPSDRDLFIQAGADEFLAKPLSKIELVRLLDKYSQQRARRSR